MAPPREDCTVVVAPRIFMADQLALRQAAVAAPSKVRTWPVVVAAVASAAMIVLALLVR